MEEIERVWISLHSRTSKLLFFFNDDSWLTQNLQRYLNFSKFKLAHNYNSCTEAIGVTDKGHRYQVEFSQNGFLYFQICDPHLQRKEIVRMKFKENKMSSLHVHRDVVLFAAFLILLLVLVYIILCHIIKIASLKPACMKLI